MQHNNRDDENDKPSSGQMTTNELLDQLSFQTDPMLSTRQLEVHEPMAPPPAAPPPPPPPLLGGSSSYDEDCYEYGGYEALTGSETDAQNDEGRAKPQHGSNNELRVSDRFLEPSSSHNSYTTTTGSTPRSSTNPMASISYYPNVNIGVANAVGRATLQEIVLRMRLLNLTLCAWALLMAIPSWLGNVVTLHPARLVLGIYLAFFSCLLCGFECHQRLLARIIRDNFGILYTPHGRALVLFLMGGLSIGQSSAVLEYVLGCCFIGLGLYTLYIVWRHPEFQNVYKDEGLEEPRQRPHEGLWHYWANPETVPLIGNEWRQ